jgi:hypothetical protein
LTGDPTNLQESNEIMSNPLFRVGEATVFAKEGQFTDAMPEIVIGTVDGPAGHAFATMMGQTAGHKCFPSWSTNCALSMMSQLRSDR